MAPPRRRKQAPCSLPVLGESGARPGMGRGAPHATHARLARTQCCLRNLEAARGQVGRSQTDEAEAGSIAGASV